MSLPLSLHTLPDGRTLEYAEYGDPDGTPVVFHHGFMCTHRQVSICHEAAKAARFRIIAPHRPGYGSTSFVKHTPLGYAADIIDLLQHLEIDQHQVIGSSGGTAFAFAQAIFAPERVSSICIVSGMFPFRHNALRSSQSIKTRLKYALFGAIPSLSHRFILKKVDSILADPEAYYESLLRNAPKADRDALQNPTIRAALTESFRSCAPQGTTHLAHEYGVYWNWGFNETDLPATTPIHIFHGKKDRLSPMNYVRTYATSLPQARLHEIEGGHFAVLGQIDEILGTLTNS